MANLRNQKTAADRVVTYVEQQVYFYGLPEGWYFHHNEPKYKIHMPGGFQIAPFILLKQFRELGVEKSKRFVQELVATFRTNRINAEEELWEEFANNCEDIEGNFSMAELAKDEQTQSECQESPTLIVDDDDEYIAAW